MYCVALSFWKQRKHLPKWAVMEKIQPHFFCSSIQHYYYASLPTIYSSHKRTWYATWVCTHHIYYIYVLSQKKQAAMAFQTCVNGFRNSNLFVQAHRHSTETDGSNGNGKLWKAGNFCVTFTSFKQICKSTFRSSSTYIIIGNNF